jgi:predicted NBD/HSP70 family sugar kinase
VRRINPTRFQIATRGTSREINSRIVLNLVRTHQPISRADLARTMGVSRAAVSLIVSELLARKLVFEGAAGQTLRGRRPKFLYINARRRSVVTVDVRASETFVMLADLMGKPLSGILTLPTVREPKVFVQTLAARITALVGEHGDSKSCEGVGVVVPGMVEHSTMRVLHAPTLGWRDVDLREPLAAATGLRVQIENSGRACALAQLWAMRDAAAHPAGDLVFVTVSDGVGVGVVMNGEVLRGRHNVAGEFGHIPLSLDGPRCSCGANGCWEAYVANPATLARYFGRSARAAPGPGDARDRQFTVDDLVTRARGGDAKAIAAIEATARYLGLGLASVINAVNPGCVFIGGEITLAWDLIEGAVRSAIAERVLTPAAAATELRVVAANEYPRLQGAAALITAPAFAAPVVA